MEIPHCVRAVQLVYIVDILFNKHIMTAVIHEGDVCDTSRSVNHPKRVLNSILTDKTDKDASNIS
ncbi:hypothetical protein NQ317_004637 [Molorchus minor]|uniref:Uncharacterized protein n=1 Tax=Molorchus minor TaxID=1323400 RepID=A0ABQ9IYX7_9CUCU|nr:hypothetical protein NQ317_004637 [Molorchus minor]